MSIKEVAALAGVSAGTVSNVLNRPARVRAVTRDRVRAVMAEVGFVRNESARQLRAGHSRSVAYVVLDATNPFFTDVALGVEDVVQEAGLTLFLCNSRQDSDRQAGYLRHLEQQRVHGVLLTPVPGVDELVASLAARGTPVVLVDEPASERLTCSVTVDDRRGGRLAVEHLVERGHERVAFVGGPAGLRQVRDRRDGARDVAGVELVELETVVPSVEEGRRAASRLAAVPRTQRPTAAFCANDLLALGLLQGCVERGLDVPGDLAIVGYDDITFAAAAAVPLTSVRRPRQEMGRAAARLLLDEGIEHDHQQLTFQPDLVVRRSTTGDT